MGPAAPAVAVIALVRQRVGQRPGAQGAPGERRPPVVALPGRPFRLCRRVQPFVRVPKAFGAVLRRQRQRQMGPQRHLPLSLQLHAGLPATGEGRAARQPVAGVVTHTALPAQPLVGARQQPARRYLPPAETECLLTQQQRRRRGALTPGAVRPVAPRRQPIAARPARRVAGVGGDRKALPPPVGFRQRDLGLHPGHHRPQLAQRKRPGRQQGAVHHLPALFDLQRRRARHAALQRHRQRRIRRAGRQGKQLPAAERHVAAQRAAGAELTELNHRPPGGKVFARRGLVYLEPAAALVVAVA